MTRDRVPAVVAMALLAWGAAGAAWAAPELAGVFGHAMVVQRDAPLPVWGRATPGADIAVAFKGDTQTATAGADGRWRVVLGPFAADAEPATLVVTGDGGRLEVGEILVGDVWLCAGQSNMQMPLKDVENGEAEVEASANPLIRMVFVGGTSATPLDDWPLVYPHLSPSWLRCGPETTRYFSALAYFFARAMAGHSGVPQGMIETSEGSTPLRSWIPERVQAGHPAFAQTMAEYATYAERKAAHQVLLDAYEAAVADGAEPPAFPGWFEAYGDAPGLLYNARIHPVGELPIRGVLWYQGENEAIYHHADTYAEQAEALVAGWRERLGRADLPFVTVELAPLNQPQTGPVDSEWAEVRDAQRRVAERVAGVALVATSDLCDADLHPKKKAELAGRMALAARALAYGEAVRYAGPRLVEVRAEGPGVTLRFDTGGTGLATRGGPPEGFAVAGADGPYVWAEAAVDGDRVRLRAPGVPAIRAVRYRWADHPKGNLFDADGLPAPTFRIDGNDPSWRKE